MHTPWLYSKVCAQQKEVHMYNENMYNKLQSSIICFISQWKTTQVSINRMDIQITV